jgi:hypothetical protein
MTDGSAYQTAEQIILALPTEAELPKLRAKVKRFKSPELPVGGHWENSKVGIYKTEQSPDGVLVTWRIVGGVERTDLWERLCTHPMPATQRLELGWMIANMLGIEAVRALSSIPGPNEAMEEANFYWREENRWRKWALVGSLPTANPAA